MKSMRSVQSVISTMLRMSLMDGIRTKKLNKLMVLSSMKSMRSVQSAISTMLKMSLLMDGIRTTLFLKKGGKHGILGYDGK